MKHMMLTSIAALALVACGDTSESDLDNSYQGGGDAAVELVEGTPEPVVEAAETETSDTEIVANGLTVEGDEAALVDESGEVSVEATTELSVDSAPAEEPPVEAAVEELESGDLPSETNALDETVADIEAGVEDTAETLMEEGEDLVDEAEEALEDVKQDIEEDVSETDQPG